jgi:hypothetical protein
MGIEAAAGRHFKRLQRAPPLLLLLPLLLLRKLLLGQNDVIVIDVNFTLTKTLGGVSSSSTNQHFTLF